MPRPVRCRRVEQWPAYRSFSPDDISATESVQMTVDEYEVLRLLDDEGLTQEDCANKMNIARTTVTAIYDSARKKIADTIVRGKRLVIAGGCCEYKPVTQGKIINKKRRNIMRIAVTYENGEIFQHFGRTEQFKVYDIENGEIKNAEVVGTNGNGHGALAGFLMEMGVDTLICGGIGGGAQNALIQAGIKLYGGVSGNADEAAKALASGTLEFNPDVQCNHHGHHSHGAGHSCGDHGCHH